eukprot:TRINITY_DN55779_c0_g1_i1.p1 TRINITY_DN55779_c0_g1~~TRINITY_DN55779_c0_g1_i1.p1  ORF type:complete len:596 (-),score=99.33 TRINITY_DN55779_c0_g1_i1:58-1845(-)
MGRRTSARPVGLGKAIESDQRRRAAKPETRVAKHTGVAEAQSKRSVLEQNSLDDFMSRAELSKQTFESTRGEAHPSEGLRLVSVTPCVDGRTAADAPLPNARSVVVPVPRRPPWTEDMGAEELVLLEGHAFLLWRRELANLEETDGVVMTPYEKNLDFWRQLWRTVERSDLLVQIIDARDPLFYRSEDLERYVSEFAGKRHMLLLNKADFVPAALRRDWAAYFASRGVEVLFFSAFQELQKQQRPGCISIASDCAGADGGYASGRAGETDLHGVSIPHGVLTKDDTDVLDCARLLDELRARLPPSQIDDGVDVKDCAETVDAADSKDFGHIGVSSVRAAQGTIGFVGYPNVGKSSVINALFGSKKVSMSRVPGKTKHLQTLDLLGAGITLCDCPGLVFPSVVATKAHLVINGTVPLDELRDHMPAVRLVVEKMGATQVLDKYGVRQADVRDGVEWRGEGSATDAASEVLAGIATKRQHFLRLHVPDVTWAARLVLRDYCTGELLHCETSPALSDAGGYDQAKACGGSGAGAVSHKDSVTAHTVARVGSGEQVGDAKHEPVLQDSDFDDFEDFLNASGGTDTVKSKRQGGHSHKRR